MSDELEQRVRTGVARQMSDLRQSVQWVLEQVDDADLNWRPNAASNSMANLVVHIAGNIRERFGTVIAGEPAQRDRDAEFAIDLTLTRAEAAQLSRDAFALADRVLQALPPGGLSGTVDFRGQRTAVVDIVLNAVGHYEQHVGQLFYIAKLRRGDDYRVYRRGLGAPPGGGARPQP